ncbi:MAG: 16S rRNA (adenine(1518)-N(6)/adenine(1519)-N(6))-dimethyltransferase RsmA [archaeon]|jgi:16S rRNA (adenine1518-N6/adenine1519-N6)-dimethyltransferase
MIKDLYTQMLKYNFKPNHSLDQNFIVDDGVIKRVVEELSLKKTDVVLEVGPGTGFLTKQLLTYCKVIAIEKDKKMIVILEQEFVEEIKSGKLVLINDDFLKQDLEKYKFTKIATFLPYSISQDFIEKILSCFVPVVAIVQKEFGEKLTSFPGFINYNAISALCQSYYKITFVRKVGKNSFFPVPNCDSAIITMIPNKKTFDHRYNEFVKGIFRYPNKDVSNALNLFSRDVKIRGVAEKAKDLKVEITKKKIRQLEIKELEKMYSVVY